MSTVDDDALERAIEFLRSDRLDDADALLGDILAAEPGHADALHFLGVLRHAQGRNDDGIALIRESLTVAPRNAGAAFGPTPRSRHGMRSRCGPSSATPGTTCRSR